MADEPEDGLLRFLATKRSLSDLKIALAVLREFKKCEITHGWAAIPFATWTKLEQLEDYLKLLTDTQAGEVRDARARDYLARVRAA
jgi:hypothetical protein